jgi:peptidoglycan/xylan/chitin deacetylase (PgdA/CDA1 family)
VTAIAADDPEVPPKRLRALLDRANAEGRTIRLWWRDDDAVTVTSALERLLALARAHDLPLALAIVPEGATAALAERLAGEPNVAVLQHGWRHRNHAAEGAKKIELGGNRPADVILDDLRRGRDRLVALFGDKALPILVPPWNRIAPQIRDRIGEIGLRGLSTYGPAPGGAAHVVNTHVDLFAWRPARRPLTLTEARARLIEETARRLAAADDEPIGILTHHLVHEAESWDVLAALFPVLARHPAVRWPAAGRLFAL